MDVNKCSITRFPAPVLARPAKPIAEITDDIRRLAERVGLASTEKERLCPQSN
ncbi:MAG TPA: hypothetical protein HPP51_03590 [Planctomycetes bacterium]|nr:hypothetical protein [Planctomycetota bacterium]